MAFGIYPYETPSLGNNMGYINYNSPSNTNVAMRGIGSLFAPNYANTIGGLWNLGENAYNNYNRHLGRQSFTQNGYYPFSTLRYSMPDALGVQDYLSSLNSNQISYTGQHPLNRGLISNEIWNGDKGYTLPPEPKLELTSYNPNNQVNSNVKVAETNSPATTTNTGSNTPASYTPRTPATNIYDTPTLTNIRFNNQGFDPTQFQTQEQTWWGGNRTNTDFRALGNAWLDRNADFRDNYFNQWALAKQDAYYKALQDGSLDLNRIQNAGQLNTFLDQYMANQKNSQWTKQDTFSAIQGGIQGINALANIYFGYKQYKLAKQNQEENLRLQRANYRNQARHMNQQYRDKMAGRGTTVQSASANRALGRMYANRKLDETY